MGEGLECKKKAIEELGIGEGVFDELLRCFIPEAEAEIEKLDDALKADNFEEIAQIGHGLKGMAGNLRISRMQDAAKAIEMSAKENNKDMRAIKEKAAELKQGLAELKQSYPS